MAQICILSIYILRTPNISGWMSWIFQEKLFIFVVNEEPGSPLSILQANQQL